MHLKIVAKDVFDIYLDENMHLVWLVDQVRFFNRLKLLFLRI
jgi:hypothetical protein